MQERHPSGAFTGKRHAKYRFSILLIDDMPGIGLEQVYRITMCPRKENDMTHIFQSTLAACAAVFLTLGSISAIVTVPPAQAETPTVLPMPVLA
jgi:hypothetical protein